MNVKLLVTDLDGTLLDSTGAIHAKDRRAIRRLLERGVIVSIATGRMYSGTRHIAHELGLSSPVACVDGSHIVDPTTDRHLLHQEISEGGLEVARAALLTYGPTVFAFASDVMVHQAEGVELLPYVSTWTHEHVQVDDVFAHGDWGGVKRPVALIAIGSQVQLRGVESELARSAEPLQCVVFEITHPYFLGMWGMVIRGAFITKATAVEWLAQRHGCSLTETITVGDWLNDVPMLLAAGHSFAMNQAPPEVKRAARYVLDASSSSGGGIHEAAERCGLL